MVFRNTELKVVLKRMEANYGVAVRMDCAYCSPGELFTGTLPANSLNEALEILEKSFHLHAATLDGQVELTCLRPAQ
jgi:hypothetical protein